MGGRYLAQTCINSGHHSVDFSQDLIIPEAKHSIAMRIEESGAVCIGSDSLGFAMLAAIHFNDDALLVAREVDEVGTDRRLATEMRAFCRQASQVPPELSLGIGHGAPKRASARHAGVQSSRL